MNKKLPLISCDQKLSDLSPTSCGRFCHSCLKEVIDFRQMSKEEILAVHQSTRGKLCGMYKEEQVKVIKTISPKHPSMQGGKAWYLGLLGIHFAETADAQEVSDSTKVEQMEITKEGIRIGDNIYSYHGGVIWEIKNYKLKGKVLFKDSKEPVLFANVVVRETNNVVSTDFDGYFQLDLEKAFQRSEKVNIEFSYLGLETKQVILTKTDTVFSRQKEWLIEIEEKEIAINEIVIVGGIGSLMPELPTNPKKGIWSSIKRFFRFEWLRKE